VTTRFYVERESTRARLVERCEWLRDGLASAFSAVSFEAHVDPVRARDGLAPVRPAPLPGGSIVSRRV
jgi:hypothetical protein